LDFIGNQTACLADVGNPEAAVQMVLLNVLYRGRNQVEPVYIPAESFPERNPVALSNSDFKEPITRLCMDMMTLNEGP
jgi:hypothetical protein